jgi:hypothetical protein
MRIKLIEFGNKMISNDRLQRNVIKIKTLYHFIHQQPINTNIRHKLTISTKAYHYIVSDLRLMVWSIRHKTSVRVTLRHDNSFSGYLPRPDDEPVEYHPAGTISASTN